MGAGPHCPALPLSTAQSSRVVSVRFHGASCLAGRDGSQWPVAPKQPSCSAPLTGLPPALGQEHLPSKASMWHIEEPACARHGSWPPAP